MYAIGAHTLGRAHPAASGYTNPWINGARERQLDVGYYEELVDLNWRQVLSQLAASNIELQRISLCFALCCTKYNIVCFHSLLYLVAIGDSDKIFIYTKPLEVPFWLILMKARNLMNWLHFSLLMSGHHRLGTRRMKLTLCGSGLSDRFKLSLCSTLISVCDTT